MTFHAVVVTGPDGISHEVSILLMHVMIFRYLIISITFFCFFLFVHQTFMAAIPANSYAKISARSRVKALLIQGFSRHILQVFGIPVPP